MTVLTGDCRDLMLAHGPFDMIAVDPPRYDTSLAWDRRGKGWPTLAHDVAASAERARERITAVLPCDDGDAA